MAAVIRFRMHWVISCRYSGRLHGTTRCQVSRWIVMYHILDSYSRLTNNMQPRSRALGHGNVWFLLLRVHPRCSMHHLVRYPILLCWQYSLCYVALHLWEFLERI